MCIQNEERRKYARQFAHLTFADNFMFTHVMENIDIAKAVLQLILAEDIPEIADAESEKVIKVSVGKHGVRYDIHIRTKSGENIYNVEMQKKDEKNTAKRARYYQSTSDAAYLNQGLDYNQLPNHYTIFICHFDPFEKNKALYRFYNYDPVNQLTLDDGTTKIFLYVGGKTDREELSNFMKYITTGEASDSLTAEIDDEVEKIRESSEAFIEYIDMMIHDKEIREKSRDEGRAEGSLITLIELAKDGNLSIEVAAHKAKMTVDEFRKKMEE